MTTVTRLTDATANERPDSAHVWCAVLTEADERKAIAEYTSRYDRVPERVFVWRGMMYVEAMEGEK